MKKNRLFALVLVVALMLTALAGCGSSSGGTIKIGAIDPLTGAQALFGQDEKQGKEMAVAELNKAGGILGKQIELIHEDDGAQAPQAAAAATKLITKDKVVAISGAHASGTTLAVMEVIAEHGIPCITPGASSPRITNSGNEWISRGIPDDILQSKILVKYAKEVLGFSKLGLLYANDDYGQGGYGAAVDAAKEFGVELVAESFMGDDQNFTPQISKLKDAGVEGVMLWCVYTPGSLICKQIRDMGWEVQMLGSPGVNNPQAFELSDNAIDGIIMTTGFVAKDPDQYVQDWITRYQEMWGMEPSQTSAVGYDSIMLLAEAIERAGSTEPAAIQREIRNTKDFKSLKGMLTINSETGEYECEIRLVQADAATKTFIFIDTYNL